MGPGNGSARSQQPLSLPLPGTARRTITRITCANNLEATPVTTCAIRDYELPCDIETYVELPLKVKRRNSKEQLWTDDAIS